MSSGSRLWMPRLPGPEMSTDGVLAGEVDQALPGEPTVELAGLLRGELPVGVGQ